MPAIHISLACAGSKKFVSEPEPSPRVQTALKRAAAAKAALARLDLVCAGTLSERMKICGNPRCRCRDNPPALHGPYVEWTRLVDGRFTNTTVAKEDLEKLTRAIANMRTARRLLRAWERASLTALGLAKKRKPRSPSQLRQRESRRRSAE
jgi:hypothetical protein